ncbi:hypothetical protein JHD48_10545, partial [Sulfurimonas sp. SAG-AH-194-I05]
MLSLYLDDLRVPDNTREWVVVRSFTEAVRWMKSNGCPDMISFDHDLGMIMKDGKILTDDYDAKNGNDVARWLIQKDIDLKGKFIPKDFIYR